MTQRNAVEFKPLVVPTTKCRRMVMMSQMMHGKHGVMITRNIAYSN